MHPPPQLGSHGWSGACSLRPSGSVEEYAVACCDQSARHLAENATHFHHDLDAAAHGERWMMFPQLLQVLLWILFHVYILRTLRRMRLSACSLAFKIQRPRGGGRLGKFSFGGGSAASSTEAGGGSPTQKDPPLPLTPLSPSWNFLPKMTEEDPERSWVRPVIWTPFRAASVTWDQRDRGTPFFHTYRPVPAGASCVPQP